jgi:protein-disulfide isomerase
VAKSSKSSAKSGPNRNALLLGGTTVLLVAAYLLLSGRGAEGATEPVEISTEMSELQKAVGVKLGPDGAPVTLVEFADFQCPACANFSMFVHPLIKERLIDKNIVQLVRYDFPIVSGHPHAFLAARAARCAQDQGRFWEFHDVVYADQRTWSISRDPSKLFVEYAGRVGLNEGQFRSCVNSDMHAEEVTRNLRLGESLGVGGTPTMMINGEKLNPADYNELEARIFEAAGMTAPEPLPNG